MELDAGRVLRDLRELDRLTGGPDGARRVCWTPVWQEARDFLRGLLEEIDGVTIETDEAANLWATLPGELDEAVAVGSHIDSVPNGGWLDGALGVMTAVEVLRVAGSPRRTLKLVDFADEEGARFGRSLFGSSAVSGTLDVESLPAEVADVVAEYGVDLARIGDAQRMREGLVAYLELHIEQGPVLEREGMPVAAVSGTAGVERRRFVFTGQAAHAGTTPMEMRHDAGLAAARLALQVEQIAMRHGGVGTTGGLRLEPGIPTAVPGRAELLVDLRHPEAAPLAAMLHETQTAAGEGARARGCSLAEEVVWRIEPITFDSRLVSAALEAAGTGRVLASGALHDAAEMARHIPTVMLFTSSTGGLSHAQEEDTPEDDLRTAIEAFGKLAGGAIAT
jgi:hydantoinase/carbamoylase family amidase